MTLSQFDSSQLRHPQTHFIPLITVYRLFLFYAKIEPQLRFSHNLWNDVMIVQKGKLVRCIYRKEGGFYGGHGMFMVENCYF